MGPAPLAVSKVTPKPLARSCQRDRRLTVTAPMNLRSAEEEAMRQDRLRMRNKAK